jgi:hypothetical protein
MHKNALLESTPVLQRRTHRHADSRKALTFGRFAFFAGRSVFGVVSGTRFAQI